MLPRLGRSVASLAAVLAVAAFATACGSDESSRAASKFGFIDERRGAIRGVAIGADKRAVRRALGSYERPPQAYPIEPLEVDEGEGSGGPWSVETGPHHLGPGGIRGEQVTLRYQGASFFVRRDRVFGFMITAPGTPTSRGVSIGDRLKQARKAYPSLKCEAQSQGDTTAVQKAACFGKAPKGRYIYFGGDPIESITVMERPFAEYAY